MGTEQKAELTGTITYSDSSNFTGWLLLGLVPPLRGATPYTTFYKKYTKERVKLPQWITFPVRDGEILANAKIRFNSSIEPPNTKYAAFFVDYEGNTLATSTVFSVEATPYELVEPSFSIPTAGSTAPSTCAEVSVSALSTPVWEVPSGTVDGVNDTFTLSIAPPSSHIILIVNGATYIEGIGYTLSGNTITFEAGYIPFTGASLLAIIF